MLIWPFLAVTGILLSILSYTVFSIEKDVIMRNWENRRCDIPVLFGASYFKPQSDPRSASEFASENFSFCAKKRVTQVMEMIMAPFMVLISGQMRATGSIGNGLQIIRGIFAQISKAFMSFLEPFYRRFVNTAYQVMAITQRLNMAYQRINTIVLAFVYSGLTIIRGMINVKDFIIKVVLIILGIMVALIIILFFVLAPFIGTIIIPVIGVISAAVGGAAVGGMADAFCLAPETAIQMEDGTAKAISGLRVGDSLKEGGKVQGIIKTTGEGVKLWNLHGNLVSSFHIVRDSARSTWCFAKDHSDAFATTEVRETLYCLNTEHRVFKTASGLLVRDWEELLDTDDVGNMYYEAMVNSFLNRGQSAKATATAKEMDDLIKNFEKEYSYKVHESRSESEPELKIGDKIYDSKTTLTTIVGLADTVIEHVWVRSDNGVVRKINLKTPVRRIFPLTESGCIALFSKKTASVYVISDFTEIGTANISKTYDYILSRLILE